MASRYVAAALTASLALCAWPALASAHGLAGKRFFPSTLTIDDPFVADELSLPTFLHIKEPGERPGHLHLGRVLEAHLPRPRLDARGGMEPPRPRGATAGRKAASATSSCRSSTSSSPAPPTRRFSRSAFGWEAGGTGRKKAGAESFDVFKPALLFGKGMGDLPEALRWLKPLAVTGIVEGVLPTRSGNKTFILNDDGDLEVEIEKNPNVFHWGFAVMYSLPYLQSFVKDVGLPAVINRLIPLVEIDINNPLDRGFAGKTTGTVNPGIIWAGKYFQLGLEAVVPINERTGKNVGIRGQVHFFLDDIFPTTIGRPLFNW